MMTAATSTVGLAVWGLLAAGPECKTLILITWTCGVVTKCWITAAGIAGAMVFVATIRTLDVAKQGRGTKAGKHGSAPE